MRFANPNILWLLLLVPVVGFLLALAANHRKTLIGRFAIGKSLEHYQQARNAITVWTRNGLLLLGMVCLIFALARPQWGYHEREVITQGVDMMIAIDTSASMMARDFPPTRLTRAKELLRNLIWEAKGSRVGIVAFAGSATVMCPLTLDYNMAATALKAVDMNTVSARGTNIGAAITAANGAFEVSGANDRILVLLTDGEQMEQQDALNQAVAKAKQDGVHIFAIGLGSPEGSTIPTLRGPLRDQNGNVVTTKLDFATLERIAKETGGSALRAEKMGATEIAQISNELAKFRGRKQQDKKFRVYQERYPLFLAAALVCLLLEALLRETRRISWPRRKNRSANAALIVLLGGFIAFAARDAAAYPGEAFVKSRDGLQNYNSGEFDKSIEDYKQALAHDPDNPLLAYNLGAALARAGKNDEARETFGKVYDPANTRLNSIARYGMATLTHRALRKDIADNKKKWEQELALGKPEARQAVQANIDKLKHVAGEYKQVIRDGVEDLDVKVNYELVKRDIAELEKLLKDNEQKQKQQQPNEQQQKNDEQKKDQQKSGQQDQQQDNKQKDKGQQKEDQKQQNGQQDQKEGQNKDQQQQNQNKPGDKQKDQQKQPGDQNKPENGNQDQQKNPQGQNGNQQSQQPQPDNQGKPTPTPAPNGTPTPAPGPNGKPSPTPGPSPTPFPEGTPAGGQPGDQNGEAGPGGKGEKVPVGQMSKSDVDRLLNTLPPENQQALQLMMGAPTQQQDMKNEW